MFCNCSTCFLWLACICFIPCLSPNACEQKSLGKHAFLSSWCLRYGLNDMIFALYCLSAWEIYLKICKTLCEAPLWYAKVLPKSYDVVSWKPYTHMLLAFALSFVKLLWPSREIFFMLSWSRFTCTPHTPLLCFFEKLALYHPPIPQNKCSTVCVGFSLSLSSYC